jgi:ubiquinol-cytochrome c reductase cytochrome c subunit
MRRLRVAQPNLREGKSVNEQLEPDASDPALDADIDGLGFEPAVAARPERPSAKSAARRTSTGRRRGHKLRTRLGAGAVLVSALGLMGGVYSAFAASSTAADSSSNAAAIAQGQRLFSVSCITCHGVNLEGIQGRGPALIGVGSAAVYFQVSTGRMPLAQQGVEAARKTPRFTDKQVRALAAYVQSVGGGPQYPTGSLRVSNDAEIADGGELFRLNCAQCHGATGHGAPLSAGKYAPKLMDSTDLQIYTAMQSGPENMPVFSDNQITPDEKKEIVSYVQNLKATADPGGSGIGRIGPVSEAIVIWVAGVGALIIAILWIGAKSQ